MHKNITKFFHENFPKCEDAFKYFDIFKKTMSGTLGKNLLNMEFPLAEEKEGGKQEFLLKLRDSKLEDDDMLNEFYQKVIDNYDYASNYYIILIHAVYDVPGKATDGSEMFDSSDSVYDYIICSICPVNLSKSGLSYDSDKNTMTERVRDWIVSAPANGFLFPVFNDRATDIHGILYYSKNPEELQETFIDNVLGSMPPITAKNQKEIFNEIITNTLGEEADFETVKSIHETLNDRIEKNKEEPEPLVLTKTDMKQIFQDSSVSNDKLEILNKEIETVSEEQTFVASNIVDTKKFNIELPDVVIKVSPDRTDLVETRIIDGRQCLVIKVTDRIQVNGVSVLAASPQNHSEEE